jgi:hypothetical protein
VASAAVAGALHAASTAGIQNPHHSWLSGGFDDIGDAAPGAWDWSEHHAGAGPAMPAATSPPSGSGRGTRWTVDGRDLMSREHRRAP